MDKKNYVVKVLIFIFFSIMTLSFVYPLFFMIMNAIKTKKEYNLDPFAPPQDIFIGNFMTMISQFKILRLFKNTLIVSGTSVILLLLTCTIASYAFAKLNFKGKRFFYLAIISTMFIPGQVTMIPAYVMFARAGLVNNYWSVILSYVAGMAPGAILLMVANFRGISNDLLEAGKIDGCTFFQTIRNIVIPMGLPAIVIAFIFNFMFFWNDLFTPMILLQKMEVRTVTAALASLMSRYNSDPPYQLAGLVLSAMPAILVYCIFQKYIVKGMTMGSFR